MEDKIKGLKVKLNNKGEERLLKILFQQRKIWYKFHAREIKRNQEFINLFLQKLEPKP